MFFLLLEGIDTIGTEETTNPIYSGEIFSVLVEHISSYVCGAREAFCWTAKQSK